MILSKNILVIILTLSLAVPGRVMVFVLDLPVIVKHFNHHRESEFVSFIDFIHEHSANNNHPEHEKNHPDHGKLPFHQDQSVDGHKNLISYQFDFKTGQVFIAPLSTQLKFFSQTLFPNSLYKKGIWHPPKYS